MIASGGEGGGGASGGAGRGAVRCGGRQAAVWWAIALAGAAAVAVLQGEAIVRQSLTSDEAYHVLAGEQDDRYGQNRINLEHPPLIKMVAALPVAGLARPVAEPLTADAALHRLQDVIARPDAEPRARIGGRCLVAGLFGLPLLAAVFLLGREVGGGRAGLVLALVMGLAFCTVPMLDMVYTDVAAALGFAVALVAAARYLRRPGLAPAVLLGVGLGLAVASKFTGLLALPIPAGALLLGGAASGRRWGWGEVGRRVAHAGLIAAIAWGAIEGVYAVADRHYDAAAGRQAIALYCENRASMQVGDRLRRFEAPLLALERRDPRAAAWATGLLATRALNALGTYPACNFGRMHSQGLWWYFPVALLARTPLALLAATVAALVAAGLGWRRGRGAVAPEAPNVPPAAAAWRRRLGWILAATAAVYVATAMGANYNVGLRHLLPVLPILYLPAARWAARRPAVAAALLAVLCCESLAVAPLWVGATNTWWLAERNPLRFALSTDNCTYLQNLIALREAVDRGGLRPLRLLDPAVAQPQADAYLGAGVSASPESPLAPGWYAVGTSVEVCIPAILRASPEEMFGFSRYRAIALRWQPAAAALAAAGEDHGFAGGSFHLYRLTAPLPPAAATAAAPLR